MVLASDGNLILFDFRGIPKWSSMTTNKGVAPYQAVIQNDGNFCIYDIKNRSIWCSNSNQSGTDIRNIQTPITGFTIKDTTNNKIYLSFKQGIQSTALNSVFMFQNIVTTTYSNKCNVNTLKDQCNNDSTCTGFIHSDVENAWQKLVYNSTEKMFKITDKIPQLYLKESIVDMQDKSCMKGPTTFVDPTTYMNYPKKYNFIMNGNQCNTVDKAGLPKKRQKYDSDNVNYLRDGRKLIDVYPKLPEYTMLNENLNTQITKKSEEYEKVMNDIDKKKSKFSSTYQQQQNDLMMLENSNKANSIMWGISSLVIIAIVVAMRNRS